MSSFGRWCAFLAQLNTLARQRKLEKRNGRRSPGLEWAEALAAAVALGRPRAAPRESVAMTESLAAAERVATPPEFAIGVHVEVILNARNRTPRHGLIERRVWHFDLGRWLYFLRHGSRRI